jgi:triacylglycerol lipase
MPALCRGRPHRGLTAPSGGRYQQPVPTPSSARGLLRALVVLLAVVPLGAVPAAQAEPGPPYTVPQAEREAALDCYGSLTSSPRVPVLLVHGTGVNSEIEWDITYRPELERLGHSVCTVDLPERGDGDVQDSVQVVAFAMREMVRRSGGRKLSVLGHSQGAFQPTYALRLYPDLARHVEDFIGLAGIYHQGSAAISEECEQACPASFRQMGSDSRLLRELNRRPMPPGPAYTAIGTLVDGTVTPQPAVNRLERGVSVQIQDICPGRRWPVPEDHVLLVGDAVAYELVMDALQHAGPASPARIDRASCATSRKPTRSTPSPMSW